MFDIAFSYIPDDMASLCQLYPKEQEYLLMKSQIEENYEKFRVDFVEKASEVACGMVVVTCRQQPEAVDKIEVSCYTKSAVGRMEGKKDEKT